MPDMRPALPVATEVDTNRVRVDARTGDRYVEYEMVYTEYDVGRIRAGYCCIECGEAHEEAFPDTCICGFPMKEKQAQKFAEQFEGYTTIGPSKSLEELRLEDEEEKARSRYRIEKPTSQIWLPGA